MTHKTKTTITKKLATVTEAIAIASVEPTQADKDAKTALLIVSLAVNMFILTAWIALQVTTVYDYQVATFLFAR